jgi:Holliday junction resolvase RusA-like endonuclease
MNYTEYLEISKITAYSKYVNLQINMQTNVTHLIFHLHLHISLLSAFKVKSKETEKMVVSF